MCCLPYAERAVRIMAGRFWARRVLCPACRHFDAAQGAHPGAPLVAVHRQRAPDGVGEPVYIVRVDQQSVPLQFEFQRNDPRTAGFDPSAVARFEVFVESEAFLIYEQPL